MCAGRSGRSRNCIRKAPVRLREMYSLSEILAFGMTILNIRLCRDLTSDDKKAASTLFQAGFSVENDAYSMQPYSAGFNGAPQAAFSSLVSV